MNCDELRKDFAISLRGSNGKILRTIYFRQALEIELGPMVDKLEKLGYTVVVSESRC